MYSSAWETYLPTLLRWALVGVVIFGGSYLLNKFLQRRGVKQEWARGYSFILPWFLGFLIWFLTPFITSLLLSFTKFNTFNPPEFVGLQNYSTVLTGDPNFWPGMWLTLGYAFFSVPLGMIGAMGVALLLNRDVKAIGIWRVIYYMPAVLPAAATALLWNWILSPSGILNQLLAPIYSMLNMEPLQWFTDPKLVLPSYVIMGLWGIFGSNAVIMLAGLKNIPKHLYEAAEIDGAGTFRKFFTITVPMVTPQLLYLLITGIIGALQIFTQAFFIETPPSAGQFISVLIYSNAFEYMKFGYASAMAWILMFIIMILTALVLKSSSAWVYYEAEKK